MEHSIPTLEINLKLIANPSGFEAGTVCNFAHIRGPVFLQTARGTCHGLINHLRLPQRGLSKNWTQKRGSAADAIPIFLEPSAIAKFEYSRRLPICHGFSSPLAAHYLKWCHLVTNRFTRRCARGLR
jgi:hypothetical protein